MSVLRLQSFSKIDFQRLINWIDNEKELIQFAGTIFTWPLTNNQLEDYINDSSRYVYKAMYNGKVIGHAEIYKENAETARLCRILIGDTTYRGKGLGKELMEQLLHVAFTELHVNYVHLNVYHWNVRAIKCYEKCGFQFTKGVSQLVFFAGEEWKALNMHIRQPAWKENLR
ncbi:GNAT family N-acetyltransferase [Neptunitalea chrysea]|uniref:GNAT family N-acetyltransferase n=1 Tax=Neptunitalea chrysea TaxID=1647581 RepID=A0A9W6EUK7_9FLAO|nr:GNAT family N-acetyltransferase [Neptunitalea chrysea]GLB51457.1 GNAT family N-acetyltransferase [Neptunitalea chrysea]